MTDNKMPFLLGNQIGCGWPSTDGSGAYRGSYNSANQILAQRTADINPALADVYGIGYAVTDGNNSYMQYLGAQTKKKLDTPVTKTSANAMTVTYELEVTM